MLVAMLLFATARRCARARDYTKTIPKPPSSTSCAPSRMPGTITTSTPSWPATGTPRNLTFFSGAKQTSGWQATLDRYKATYASPGHEMGTLEFSDLRVEMLGPEAAFVRGAWHLTMPDGKTPHGLFTLVFRKFPEGWKIIHDHTSAAE